MRRWLAAAAVLGLFGGCNLFGGTTTPPDSFGGWFHVDRPGRATNLAFGGDNLAEVLSHLDRIRQRLDRVLGEDRNGR